MPPLSVCKNFIINTTDRPLWVQHQTITTRKVNIYFSLTNSLPHSSNLFETTPSTLTLEKQAFTFFLCEAVGRVLILCTLYQKCILALVYVVMKDLNCGMEIFGNHYPLFGQETIDIKHKGGLMSIIYDVLYAKRKYLSPVYLHTNTKAEKSQLSFFIICHVRKFISYYNKTL